MRTFLSVLLLSLTACGSSVTEFRADASADASTADTDTANACDPHRAPCRATLTCANLEQCEGVLLATGSVERFDRTVTNRAGDVQADLGRYLGLSAASNVCRFGLNPGTRSASFATLIDVPTTPTLCAWDLGSYLQCGVNMSGYTPSCVGDGLLLRDAVAQLYRLRVVGDRADAAGWHLAIEWLAIDG